jgi:hypothetical protein
MSVSSIPAPQTPRAKPRFIFSEKSSVIDTYESYAKEGFADLITPQAEFPYTFEKQFLSKVDLENGPILVSVRTMIRTMAVDWESPKRERKEYLYYTVELEAKNRLGNIDKCSHEHEGKYIQQTKFIKTRINSTGEEEAYYERSAPRDAYTIPWNKKTADSILTGEKYFGEDSINITNVDEVQYIVKFSGNPPRTAFSQEDFLNLTYQALSDKSKTTPSPQLAELRRKHNQYG